MIGPMRLPLINWMAPPADALPSPLHALDPDHWDVVQSRVRSLHQCQRSRRSLAQARQSRGGPPCHPRLTEADLAGFDRGLLQCSESRVVGYDGVYACPILAGLPGARLTEGTLKDPLRTPLSTIQPA